MCLTFKKNNKQTKKPVNRFLQDDASAGLRSLQTSIEIKLCQNHQTDCRYTRIKGHLVGLATYTRLKGHLVGCRVTLLAIGSP